MDSFRIALRCEGSYDNPYCNNGSDVVRELKGFNDVWFKRYLCGRCLSAHLKNETVMRVPQ